MEDILIEPNYTAIDFNPFEDGREIEKIVAINESQREVWLSCAIGGEPANLAYNESNSLDLKGDFSFDVFKKAFISVVDRHEALRSTVSANGESFIIYKNVDVELKLTDISNQSAVAQQETLTQFIKTEMLTAIDLQKAPLFRVFVHQLAPKYHYFTIVIHHIICDGWSTGIILENLSKTYNALQKGLTPILPPVIQISTYAQEQFNYLQSDEFKETEQFWVNLYKGNVPVVDFPTDFERTAERSYKAHRIDSKLTQHLVTELKKTGAKAGCSLVNTMLSLFEIYLYQKTKKADLVVGLPSSGQSATENYELVGHCVNLLPIKSKIDPNISLLAYLKESKSSFLDAYDHQQLSFGQLIKKLNLKRDPTRIPLVPIVFNVDMGMDAAVSFDGLQHKLYANPREYETFELFLNATGSEETLILEWTYNTQLFKENTIKQLTNEFENLLQFFVNHPNELIKNLGKAIDDKTLAPAEVKITAGIYDGINIINMMNEIVHQFPEKIAVKYKEQSLSYQELFQKSNQLAAYLVKNGVKPGDIVALSTDRSVEMLVALLAILKTGAAYLPLDPNYPKDRIEFMLSDAGAKILLVTKKYEGHFISLVKELTIEELWTKLNQYPVDFNEKIELSQLSNIIYTSGTTGKPKGAKTTHKNLANLMASIKLAPGLLVSDKFLAITTISFDIAATELFLPLLVGAQVIIADEEEGKDGRLLLKLIEQEEITVLQATPSRWKMLLDSGWEKKYPLTVFTAGEALTKELAQQLLAKTKEVWNLYGPTETTIYSTVKKINENDPVITIGSPVQNTNIYILDEHRRPLPINSIGEIFIGGEGVADGYLNRPGLTEEKFLIDTFSNIPSAKMYGTGDLGKYLENGEIQCLGRIDHQVKIRGYRIELEEIETILAKQTEVKQAVVVAKEDASLNKKLVAYVVFDKNSKLNQDNILVDKDIVAIWKNALLDDLPAFMVPEQYIALSKLPLTPNGKIDRKALPDFKAKSSQNNERLTLTANEQVVANIWQELLKISDLKPSDDFFEVGGHSLLAVRVMMEIEKKTGTRLPLSILFDHSTIETLALQIKVKPETGWKSLVPIKTSGNQPPLYIVHGQGMNIITFRTLINELDTNQPIYGLQAKGLNPDDQPSYDIEIIASEYIEEMVNDNPNGPYAIMGYSAGGIIALEMSVQLENMGKKVSFLGLLDTYADADEYLTFFKKNDYLGAVGYTFNHIKYALSCLKNFPKAYLTQKFNFMMGTLYNTYKKINPTKADKSNPLYVLGKLQNAHLKAFKNYKLKQYNVDVHLFLADDKVMQFVHNKNSNGFGPYLNGKLTVVNVPLAHLQFFEPDHVKVFANKLQYELNKANHLD